MKKPITSASQALKESQSLTSYWSLESNLSQRILIYIAQLLEARKPKKTRKPTAWQSFLGKYLRSGKTIQQAASDWKKKCKNS